MHVVFVVVDAAVYCHFTVLICLESCMIMNECGSCLIRTLMQYACSSRHLFTPRSWYRLIFLERLGEVWSLACIV